MTEIEERTAAPLPESVRRFVAHWGSMGDHWGVNRSVSQVHALLYLSEKPLSAEQIAASLGMARSNVSTSLRELQSWELIRRAPVLGDRRDFFEAETALHFYAPLGPRRRVHPLFRRRLLRCFLPLDEHDC